MNFKYPSPNIKLYGELLDCYKRCLRNKRHLKKGKFHRHHELMMNDLALNIEHNTYYPGISSVFVVLNPKPREVVAASLRDRVVHHFIHGYMEPYWERRFLPNSYACRPGKGPLAACRDLQKFLHGYGRTQHLWYLKVDVRSFFPSIDQNILFDIIKRHLKNPRMLMLSERTLFHNPVAPGKHRRTCPPVLWDQVPRHKSLFHAKPGKGLAIGNLSSQFWANLYMNVLDQWIARAFKGKVLFWQRYVDDVLFLSEDPKQLAQMPKQIDDFLGEHLKMRLNAGKTIQQPLTRGIDHLGYIHTKGRQTIRPSVVARAEENIKQTMQIKTHMILYPL